MSEKNYVLITDEEAIDLDKMLRGIAYRKRLIIPNEYSVDDIVSEFWIVAMNSINGMGSIQKPLIAKACYARLVDIIRHSVRHNQSISMDSSILDRMGNTEDDDCEYGSAFIQCDHEDTIDLIVVRDMLDKFKEGTSERKFFEFMVKYHTDACSDKYFGEEITAMDSHLASMLGFASGSSGGYRKVRNKVRTIVRLYRLGVDINMVYALEDYGFKCYDQCIGWMKEKVNGTQVEMEVYPSKNTEGEYSLLINGEEVADFSNIKEFEVILNYIKRVKCDRT